MAYNAVDIAKKIIAMNNSDVGDVMTNLKLQKLLYYTQGFNLAMFNAPLFNEDIYAWQYGPVVIEVYDRYKEFGNNPIILPHDTSLISLKSDEEDLFEQVIDVYGQFSALKLMKMTHEELPWRSTEINEIIPHKYLKKFFTTRLEKDE